MDLKGGLKRVLVVDDESEITQYLKEYLTQQGLEVSTASTGEEALSFLESQKPHLVLVDMKLGPGITGMEVLRRAKRAKTQAEIVVVTAVDDRNVAEMALGLGASDYITKPFRVEDLERAVLSRLKT